MKIKMKSIHANIINEMEVKDISDIKAQVEVGYNRDELQRLQLNYHISVGKPEISHLYVIKCSFVIIDPPAKLGEKQILDQAVELLQERVEVILALLTEEMGFELIA